MVRGSLKREKIKMDFNSHWDILHKIMEMKEKEEYLDKVERRARNNFKRVIDEIRMNIVGDGEVCDCMEEHQVKMINGKYMFREKLNDEWTELIKDDISKETSLRNYLSYIHDEFLDGYYGRETGCHNDASTYGDPSLEDFDEYVERYIEYHCIYIYIKYNPNKKKWYKYFLYIKNDPKRWIRSRNDRIRKRQEKEHKKKHFLKMTYRSYDDDGDYYIPPLQFINRLKKGAKHYLTHKKNMDMDIIRRDNWDNYCQYYFYDVMNSV